MTPIGAPGLGFSASHAVACPHTRRTWSDHSRPPAARGARFLARGKLALLEPRHQRLVFGDETAFRAGDALQSQSLLEALDPLPLLGIRRQPGRRRVHFERPRPCRGQLEQPQVRPVRGAPSHAAEPPTLCRLRIPQPICVENPNFRNSRLRELPQHPPLHPCVPGQHPRFPLPFAPRSQSPSPRILDKTVQVEMAGGHGGDSNTGRGNCHFASRGLACRIMMNEAIDQTRAARPFQFTGRIRSFYYAIRGVLRMVRCQHNAWIHAAATLLVLGAGFYLRLSRADWCWIILAISIVWTAEALNTAIRVSRGRGIAGFSSTRPGCERCGGGRSPHNGCRSRDHRRLNPFSVR